MLSVKKNKKLNYLPFTTRKFLQFYSWKNCLPTNSINLNKKIKDCKVAIVSSAGLIVKNEQQPFDSSIKMGDSSFRIIPSNVDCDNLEEHHRSDTFNHTGIQTNPFSVMPIPHLLDLCKERFIGSVNNRHVSLMGSIVDPKQLVKKTIPEIVTLFKEDNVDIVIFIPV
ncbi:glycine/sarcosine/betaine reductase selenoprotein B family protein [Candidatus Marinimicrobia bacterium]|nr:glycine/sarcosine/betaine reductase selenoprotein B family protein [Candidatus Neomarinimicrobiota bacterium]